MPSRRPAEQLGGEASLGREARRFVGWLRARDCAVVRRCFSSIHRDEFR
ncbi:hypothetical protein MMMB2_1996 [Mycobacterium marinum MB2]|nr:hypothetical protein MMMB2_1996 [Mycobacterium marinum MB2]